MDTPEKEADDGMYNRYIPFFDPALTESVTLDAKRILREQYGKLMMADTDMPALFLSFAITLAKEALEECEMYDTLLAQTNEDDDMFSILMELYVAGHADASAMISDVIGLTMRQNHEQQTASPTD